MAKVRQLPKTFLRGSLVNVTIAHLTPVQAARVEEVTHKVLCSPVMSGHKNEFIRRLATTIAADYRDPEAAEQEFRIAIWRGVAQLLFHSQYTFKCAHCGESAYIGHYGKRIPIISRVTQCPACHYCRITNPGDSQFAIGEMVLFDKAQEVAENIRASKSAEYDPIVPVIESCIDALAGERKVNAEQAEKILQDPVQLSKYFGAFAKNYISQILNENSIQKHGRGTEIRYGSADKIIADRISNLLADQEIAHTYTNNQFPDRLSITSMATHVPSGMNAAQAANKASCARQVSGSFYCINVDQYCLPPRCVLMFAAIWRQAQQAGVKIEFDNNSILISDCGASAPTIQLHFTTNVEVSVLDPQSTQDDEGPTTMIDSVEDRSILDTDIGSFERREAFEAVRRSLSDERAQRLFDICMGLGKASDEFKKLFPGNAVQPAKSHLAKFFGCSCGEVETLKMQIGGQLLAHGILTP